MAGQMAVHGADGNGVNIKWAALDVFDGVRHNMEFRIV